MPHIFVLFFSLKELLGLRVVVGARRLPVNLYSVHTGVLRVSPVALHLEFDVAEGPGKLLLYRNGGSHHYAGGQSPSTSSEPLLPTLPPLRPKWQP